MKSDYKKLLEELKAVGQRDVVPIETIEQDYAISFLLKTMSEHPELSETLVFRGGTSFRKCYFPNYRYSMDLDYSVRGSLPLEQYNRVLGDVARQTQELMMAAHPGLEFQVALKQVGERGEHGDNQDAHKFLVKFPWHLQHKNPQRAGRMIKLDTSHSEPVLLGTEKRQLIHRYGISTVTSSVTCLTLDELLAEKYVAMCDVLSLREQDVRQSTRPRDYFDFDQVLAEHGIENKENFLSAIVIKAKRRQVEVRSLNELLSPQAVAKLETDWKPFLSQVVPGLSDCRAAVTRMEEKMQSLFPDFARSLQDCREVVHGVSKEDTAKRYRVPNLVVDELRSDSGRIDAKLVADMFDISIPILARIIGAGEPALYKTPDAKSVQSKLMDFERIAWGLLRLTGSVKGLRIWLNAPNPELDKELPIDYIKDGRVEDVAAMVEDALLGHPS